MLNQINLIGNVGGNPELRYTPSGKAVCTFSLAVSERYTKDGQKQEKTTWFSIDFWDKQAENVNEWIKKGGKVFVTGSLTLDTWEKDGKSYHKLKVNGRNFINLSPRSTTDSTTDSVDDEDEIPF